MRFPWTGMSALEVLEPRVDYLLVVLAVVLDRPSELRPVVEIAEMDERDVVVDVDRVSDGLDDAAPLELTERRRAEQMEHILGREIREGPAGLVLRDILAPPAPRHHV